MLNVNLFLLSHKVVNALIQVCTDLACAHVVGSGIVTLTSANHAATNTFNVIMPGTYYVRISGYSLPTQERVVIFGASPQSVSFSLF
jgi:hypothetical protein